LTKLIISVCYQIKYLLINKCVCLKIYTTNNIKNLNVCITYTVVKENKRYVSMSVTYTIVVKLLLHRSR